MNGYEKNQQNNQIEISGDLEKTVRTLEERVRRLEKIISKLDSENAMHRKLADLSSKEYIKIFNSKKIT